MITSLRLVNFKNFADETLHLGPFTLIVGANASGKSNIRDAFRFLEGIRHDYSLAEILGGNSDMERIPVRGTASEVIRFGHDEFTLEIEMDLTGLSIFDAEIARYSIRVRRDFENGQFRVAAESLTACRRTPDVAKTRELFTSNPHPDSKLGAGERNAKLRLELPTADISKEVASDQPVLSHLDMRFDEFLGKSSADVRDETWIKSAFSLLDIRFVMLQVSMNLSRMLFLELSPDRLREPSLPGVSSLGDTGHSLPTALEAICANPQRKAVLLSWLHELTPMDVSDLEFPVDLNGRINLRIVEADGRKISAYSASDGTLRFLGMLAALLNADFEGLYFIEEIDNGIHPARLHLLLDLIERQTAKGKIQVVATTHSPDVLDLINDTTYENAVVVYRDEDSADAVIRRVAQLPNAGELRKSQGLGRLHASGWMENTLSFAEVDGENQKGGE